MNKGFLTILLAALVLLGLGLMVGGIVAAKYGAVVIGIIVAGVAAQRWMALRKRPEQGHR